MRKTIILTAAIGMAMATPVHASSYISEDLVNVRVAPGTENQIIAQLPYGTEVEVIQWDGYNGWALVDTACGTGWVFNSLIRNEDRSGEIVAIANSYASGTDKLIIVDTNGYPMTYVCSGSSYNWSVEQIFECSVGKPETPTPVGVFAIQNKRDVIYSGDTWEYFVADFAFDENWEAWAFHSTLCEAGTYNPADDRVGEHISNGCVRLRLEDAQWMWSNCGTRTTVVIL